MHNSLNRIKDAAHGLLFMSESDYPLEFIKPETQPPGALTDIVLLEWAQMPVGTPIQKEDLIYFFRNQVRELPEHGPDEKARAAGFRNLQQVLLEELQDVAVYRLGTTRVTALIIGKTKTGEYAGLKTTLIET